MSEYILQGAFCHCEGWVSDHTARPVPTYIYLCHLTHILGAVFECSGHYRLAHNFQTPLIVVTLSFLSISGLV